MSFAVEVLLDRSVTDAFGDAVRVTHSRLRYELVIELREAGNTGALRPFVIRERAVKIRRADDQWIQQFDAAERKSLAKYSSGAADLLDTEPDDQGRPRFTMQHQANHGRRRYLPATAATASVLSTLTTATDFPLLYALKRELQSWRLLYLDPSALRRPDTYDDPDVLATNGAHLPNTLRRIVDETSDEERPGGVLNDLSADVATIIPGIVRVALSEDDARRQRQVEVVTQDEAPYSALVASDGTLRTIALLTALYDPSGAGLICFEEPENGMFPGRLFAFIESLRLLVERGRKAGTLTQLVVSSHSPAILRALEPTPRNLRRDAIYLDVATRVGKGQARSRVSKYRHLTGSPTSIDAELPPGTIVSPSELAEFEVVRSTGSLMRYLTSALIAEGVTDERFLPPLLARMLQEVCADFDDSVEVADVRALREKEGPRSIAEVLELVDLNHGSFTVVFFHHDQGARPGRTESEWLEPLQEGWGSRSERLIVAVPVRETEA